MPGGWYVSAIPNAMVRESVVLENKTLAWGWDSLVRGTIIFLCMLRTVL